MDYNAYLLTLSIAEFRRIKKAVRLLLSCGVNADNALDVIVTAHRLRREDYNRYQTVRSVVSK